MENGGVENTKEDTLYTAIPCDVVSTQPYLLYQSSCAKAGWVCVRTGSMGLVEN